MTKLKPNVTRAVALATLLGGLGACATESTPAGGPSASPGDDPVEAAIGELGVPILGCDAVTATSGNGFATNALTLVVDSDPLVLSAVGGVFTANGYKCTQTVSGKQVPLKIADVAQININGTANNNKVILDFLPGTFGTRVLAASMGGIKIDFATTTQANDSDSVMLRASALAEKYKFAALPASGTATDIYVEINNDKTADINIKLSQSSGAKLALTASMGGGGDEVIANPPAADIDKFGSATGLVVGPLPAAYGLVAYGGPGDDKFTGGFGDDSFFGGEGADTFRMNDLTDGADIYSGDLGSDTVEYGGRATGVTVDLGPLRSAAVGGADLRAPALYGASGALATKVLAFVIDGTRVVTPAFVAPSKPSDILDAINMAANTALGTTGTIYASLTGKNQLQIMSATNLPTSFVKIEDDSALGTGTEAASVFGLTAGVVASFPAVGSVDLTTAGLYGGGGTLDTNRLVLLINGVYVAVTFAAPADSTAVLTAINNAVNTALGTTGVKYAAENDTTHVLELTATKLDIKDATMAYPLSAASAHHALGFSSRVEGNVDVVNTAGLFTGSGTLANTTLGVVIDGARVNVAAGATPADINTIVSTINTDFNTELGTTGKIYAYISTSNRLVIQSNNDTGGVSSVRFLGDPAIAAVAGAETEAATTLGFTVNTSRGAKLVGTDLSAAGLYGGSGSLALARLTLVVDGTYVAIPLTAPANVTALLSDINTAIQTALGTTATYATQNAKTKRLELVATWISVKNGLTAHTFATAAHNILGLGYHANVKRGVADADDGLPLERDDVRYSTENINTGAGNDVVYGNELKNTIKTGGGNDVISGGANGATCNAADGDSLQGEAGNDTFVVSAPNCKATLSGGDGDNVADFSGRSGALFLRNNGTADDGEGTMGAEGINIGTDIKKMIGGFGVDNITGGAGDDIIVGGPGADVITGGTGKDTLDYSAAPARVEVSLCFATAISGCGTADDGMSGEGDQVFQIEYLIGTKFNDELEVHMTTTSELTFEGGDGDDTITGSLANDTIYGDAGDDKLYGGAGDDTIQGDAGDDLIDGGDGDGDICLGDAADITTARVNCEP